MYSFGAGFGRSVSVWSTIASIATVFAVSELGSCVDAGNVVGLLPVPPMPTEISSIIVTRNTLILKMCVSASLR